MPQATVIEGAELLTFISANPTLTKMELAMQAGYFKTTKEGGRKAQTSYLMDALAIASGISINQGELSRKTKSYKTKRHSNGILLIGKIYVEELLGVDPDSEFNIIIDKESESIVLEKI